MCLCHNVRLHGIIQRQTPGAPESLLIFSHFSLLFKLSKYKPGRKHSPILADLFLLKIQFALYFVLSNCYFGTLLS